ncbi:condensation domain-containing protein [Streptomyces sp. NPDC006602]|uniref:condensation domain-containing protein n=1 Tax=Streptomyces sp. NPDC006602 TaxID=3364751 RepID=UPI00369DD5F6
MPEKVENTAGEREGRLNWPQADWFAERPTDPQVLEQHKKAAYEDNMCAVVDGRGATVPQVLEALTELVDRHEALRTLLSFDGDLTGRQRVTAVSAPAVEAAVSVRSVRTAEELFAQIRHSSFEVASKWPFHVVLSTTGRRVREIGLVADHSAVDGWGMNVLLQDLDGLLRRAPLSSPDVTQPLDVVRWEDSEAGQRHLERALRYWTEQFEELRKEVGPQGGVDARSSVVPTGSDRYAACVLRSTSMLKAAEAASSSLQVPVSTVLLMAFGAALCRFTRTPAIGVLTLSHNRWLESVRSSASKMFLQAPVRVPEPSPEDLSHVARRTFVRHTQANMFAHIDRAEAEAVRDQVLPGAHSIRVAGALFNFIDTSAQSLRAEPQGPLASSLAPRPVPEGEIIFEEERRHGPQLMLFAWREPNSIGLRLAWRLNGELTRPGDLFMRDIGDAVSALARGTDPRAERAAIDANPSQRAYR